MLVGVDIGTQSLKVVVTDASFTVLGSASRRYDVHHPAAGWAEQAPSLWEDALAPAIASAVAQAAVPASSITAIGVAGQLDGCVPVGSDGAAIGPCLIWMDKRAHDVMPVLPRSFRQTTGLVADPSHMAAKVRWLQRHAPGAVRYHQPVSYVVSQLCGEHVYDRGMASTTMVYDVAGRAYDPALLNCFDIDERALPRIAAATDVAGRLTDAGARLTGLPADTIVAVGTGDDFATPLGAGVVSAGRIVVGVGTAEVVGAVRGEFVLDEAALVETHAYVNDCYFLENPGWPAGGALAWLADILATDFSGLDELASNAPPGADGLTFLPALAGAMAPEWIASARACFYGFSPAHGRAHMARAVMEGCAFAMRDVIDRLRSLGTPAADILMLGGATRSPLWPQIRADVSGLAVSVHGRSDTCALGAAMLAAVAVGAAPSLDACAELVQQVPDRVCTPEPSVAAAYDAAYERYRVLFDALRPMY